MVAECARRACDVLDALNGRRKHLATDREPCPYRAEILRTCHAHVRDAALREGGVAPPRSARFLGDGVAAEVVALQNDCPQALLHDFVLQ